MKEERERAQKSRIRRKRVKVDQPGELSKLHRMLKL